MVKITDNLQQAINLLRETMSARILLFSSSAKPPTYTRNIFLYFAETYEAKRVTTQVIAPAHRFQCQLKRTSGYVINILTSANGLKQTWPQPGILASCSVPEGGRKRPGTASSLVRYFY